MMIKKQKINSRGFTLVEMLVAVSLFVMVVAISIGAILSVFDANKKAQSSKTVVDNLNMAVENMARTVRFGEKYHCGYTGSFSSAQNCPDNNNGDTLLAVTFNGGRVCYRLYGTAIQRSDDPNCAETTYTDITSSDTVIEYLRFYVFGNPSSDTSQPYVIAVIKGRVGSKVSTQTSFSIETLMSQRTLDL